jgi:peptide/nickel transport system substrate-binding protein
MPNCYTGPYKPVKWEEGSQVVFEKNADYWGGEPYFDEIVLISIKDATARVEALEGGSVDLALEPAEDMVPAIKGNSKLTILSKPTTNHHTLFLNTTKAPFDDVHVRRALAMALDYESNIAMALNGYGKHSDSILPLGNPMYFKPDKSYYTYDLNAAVEELKLSGYFQ